MEDDMCQVILEKLSHISESVGRLDERSEARFTNLNSRVDKMEKKIDRRDEQRQAKSWQMWFLVISVILAASDFLKFATSRCVTPAYRLNALPTGQHISSTHE